MFPGREVSRKAAFERGGSRRKFASKKAGSIIPLNLPTEVQSPRVKGDGRYDEYWNISFHNLFPIIFSHDATSVVW